MINVLEFMYNELKNNTTLSGYVSNRIYLGTAPQGVEFPVIIFNRITSGKNDIKGIRVEYFQVSVWSKSLSNNEEIAGVIRTHFNGLSKDSGIKQCNITGINNSFDTETQTDGTHVDVRVKIFET